MENLTYDTFTFPSVEARAGYKQSLLKSGVDFDLKEEDDITQFHNCFFLYVKRTSLTLKQRLTKGE